jgi:hypothetical protein
MVNKEFTREHIEQIIKEVTGRTVKSVQPIYKSGVATGATSTFDEQGTTSNDIKKIYLGTLSLTMEVTYAPTSGQAIVDAYMYKGNSSQEFSYRWDSSSTATVGLDRIDFQNFDTMFCNLTFYPNVGASHDIMWSFIGWVIHID